MKPGVLRRFFDNGILRLGLMDFLLDEDSLDR